MAGRRGDRGRLLWSFLASAIINIVAWVAVSAQTGLVLGNHAETPERLAVSTTAVRIEHRPKTRSTPHARVARPIVHRKIATPAPKVASAPHRRSHRAPRRQVSPAPEPAAGAMAPLPGTLVLPHGWSRQDFGFLETTETAEWLNWKKQTARWVPRVFLWRFKPPDAYMSTPSLHDTIRNIVASLHDEGAKLYVSKAQPVCDGQRPGWYLSYVKTSDDPPLQFDETLFMEDGMVYRAMYIRAAGQEEDPQTREALNSLCT